MGAAFCYNPLEKQKCGSLRVLEHPQACAGAQPPTQRPSGRTAWNIIRHLGSPFQEPFSLSPYPGVFCRIIFGLCTVVCVPCLCRMRSVCFLRCVGFALHGVFVFHPPPGGASPRGWCGERQHRVGRGWGPSGRSRHRQRRPAVPVRRGGGGRHGGMGAVEKNTSSARGGHRHRAHRRGELRAPLSGWGSGPLPERGLGSGWGSGWFFPCWPPRSCFPTAPRDHPLPDRVDHVFRPVCALPGRRRCPVAAPLSALFPPGVDQCHFPGVPLPCRFVGFIPIQRGQFAFGWWLGLAACYVCGDAAAWIKMRSP